MWEPHSLSQPSPASIEFAAKYISPILAVLTLGHAREQLRTRPHKRINAIGGAVAFDAERREQHHLVFERRKRPDMPDAALLIERGYRFSPDGLSPAGADLPKRRTRPFSAEDSLDHRAALIDLD